MVNRNPFIDPIEAPDLATKIVAKDGTDDAGYVTIQNLRDVLPFRVASSTADTDLAPNRGFVFFPDTEGLPRFAQFNFGTPTSPHDLDGSGFSLLQYHSYLDFGAATSGGEDSVVVPFNVESHLQAGTDGMLWGASIVAHVDGDWTNPNYMEGLSGVVGCAITGASSRGADIWGAFIVATSTDTPTETIHGAEIDINCGVDTGCRIGVIINNAGAGDTTGTWSVLGSASAVPASFAYGAQGLAGSTGFEYGLAFIGQDTGVSPINATGAVILAAGVTAETGIDFSIGTTITGYFIKGPGDAFLVSGSGLVVASAVACESFVGGEGVAQQVFFKTTTGAGVGDQFVFIGGTNGALTYAYFGLNSAAIGGQQFGTSAGYSTLTDNGGQSWATLGPPGDPTSYYSNTTHAFRNRAGNTTWATITTSGLYVSGPVRFAPGASVTPASNGDVTFEFTNNTTLTIKGKGSDGTVRTATVTLA